MIIVNGLKPLTIITKSSILDVAAVLDPPLAHILVKRDIIQRRIQNSVEHLSWNLLQK